MPELPNSLILEPIGYVRTEKQRKFDAPNQPDAQREERNEIELLPGKQFDLALQDLASFDRIWLVWWFHRNTNWRPRVLPPRGPATRRGVFATRSPHRPNRIGMTAVALHEVTGLTLTVGPLDLVDGTPILDIKPYLRTVDAFPESSLGWLEEVEADSLAEPAFRVQMEPRFEGAVLWLKQNFGVDFLERATTLLARDPSPHRTRRILKMDENRYRIACGSWRVFYRIDGTTVVLETLGSGYSDNDLETESSSVIQDREAQLAYWKNFQAN